LSCPSFGGRAGALCDDVVGTLVTVDRGAAKGTSARDD
jgi:hypothetical protein